MRGLSVYAKTVNFYTTATTEVKCEMKFENYPFDVHLCYLMMLSSNHATDEMTFSSTFLTYNEFNRLQEFDIKIANLSEVQCIKGLLLLLLL